MIAKIDFKHLKKYDFDSMRTRFVYMTKDQVMEEFSKVLNNSHLLGILLQNGIINEERYFELIEPLQEAEAYLGKYLAICYLMENGYEFNEE